MKSFVSWSGGKDCTFALYKFLESNNTRPAWLLNMQRNNPNSGHRVSDELFCVQASALGLPLVRERVLPQNYYLYHFDRAINQLKSQGCEAGIFGDIYLEAHRQWIEKQCERLGIEAIFPLWGMDVEEIYKEFVEVGFKSKIIAVIKSYDCEELLGEDLSMSTLVKMKNYGDSFDVCGENGEFHTFVHSGPLFKSPLEMRVVGNYENEKLVGIELDIEK